MVHIKTFNAFALFFTALLFVTNANAAPTATPVKKDAVQIDLELFKVVMKDGKETLVGAKETKPGETLEYRATYKNISKAAVRNLAATLPVPKGMEYLIKTASPAGAEATIDAASIPLSAATFAPIPLIDAVKKEMIPANQYRALRWKVPELGAEKSIVVSARMKVSQQ